MAIVSSKELARTYEREVGKPAIVKRRFVVVLSDDTLTTTRPDETEIIAAALGVPVVDGFVQLFGLSYPSLPAWKSRKVYINEGFEGSPYHVEVAVEYGVVLPNELLSPVDRAVVWNFEASAGDYPALFHYGESGAGNGTKNPLTNSAYDYFPGLMTQESLVRATVQKNFAALPSSWFAVNNFVNSDTYLGCGPGTLRVAGITANRVTEVYGASEVSYWSATATIVFRQSGHQLQLPDVGWNFLDGGQKRRAMVFDFNNSEWIASPNPVGLNGSGAQTGGQPAILQRRVNPEAAFLAVFGTAPT
jgi:hypothetical protein